MQTKNGDFAECLIRHTVNNAGVNRLFPWHIASLTT